MSKARKLATVTKRVRFEVYPGFCPVRPLDVRNSLVGPGKGDADPLKLIRLVTGF